MLSAAQIVALIIFIVMFVLIVAAEKYIPRHYVTLGCGALTLIAVFGICMQSPAAIWESINIKSFAELSFWYSGGAEGESSAGINWETITFIAGMMIMVEGMAKAGFFDWLCMKLAKLVNYKPIPLLISFMVMSFVLAMFIDSITVILFLATVTVELGRLLKIDPVPMIMSEIFCANLGGSATMCGDPPNIIIGTSLHYTFGDFLKNTGVIAFVSFVLIITYYYLVFHKELSRETISAEDIAKLPAPESSIKSKKDFTFSSIIFAIAVILLVSHGATGLTVSTIGIFVSILTLIAAGKDTVKLLKKLDYETLLFFIGLFIVVSGLEITGILELLANLIGTISGGNLKVMVAIIIWLSAIASAIVDNIPFAATMIPVIRSLAATMGVDLDTLSWTLAMGTDVGGSATPIGASANVVGISKANRSGHHIGWGKYCKTAIPATLIVITTAMIMIFIRYC